MTCCALLTEGVNSNTGPHQPSDLIFNKADSLSAIHMVQVSYVMLGLWCQSDRGVCARMFLQSPVVLFVIIDFRLCIYIYTYVYMYIYVYTHTHYYLSLES